MPWRRCSRIASKRNRSALTLAGAAWLLLAAVAVSAEPTVELRLTNSTLQLQAAGVTADRVIENLEKGYRTILAFEVQLIDPDRVVGDVLWEHRVQHVLSYDPFEDVMYLEEHAGQEVAIAGRRWYRRFVLTSIDMSEATLSELRKGMLLRARAVWEPIYLIPGLRFLTAFVPGLQQTGPWTELRYRPDEGEYAIP